MSNPIKCPWCNNEYTNNTAFNNHFYDEDLEDIHVQNKDYKLKKAKELINTYYDKLEKQELKIKTLRNLREREQRGDISIWEVEDILQSLK